VLKDKKLAQFFLGPFLIQPIILFLFVLIFLLTDWRWSENAVVGSWAGQICLFSCPVRPLDQQQEQSIDNQSERLITMIINMLS
jgi:hypothetical protein